MGKIQMYAMGFTKKTVERFFNLLQWVKVRRIIDVWLCYNLQLASFARKVTMNSYESKGQMYLKIQVRKSQLWL